MQSIQLYIKDENDVYQQIELFKDESITLTQSIQDVKDISKIFTDYSQTFSVPASKVNNKLFKHFYNYFIDGFDARQKKDAKLQLNYKPFKTGKVKLEGATLKGNKANTYKLVRVGKYAKLKYDDLWIDIFLLDDEWGFPQQHFHNISFIEGEVYPIRKVMFGDIEINIPHKSEEYLHRILPEWDTYAVIYNHKNKGRIKMSFKDHPELLKPFLSDN